MVLTCLSSPIYPRFLVCNCNFSWLEKEERLKMSMYVLEMEISHLAHEVGSLYLYVFIHYHTTTCGGCAEFEGWENINYQRATFQVTLDQQGLDFWTGQCSS